MEAGDIALASLAQADGVPKLRPVLLLCRLPGFGDWLACGVGTQIRHQVTGFDEMVSESDHDYPASGLRQPSLIRLGFLGTLTDTQIAGSLGRVDPVRLRRLRQNLAQQLHSPV
jgi:mRNA interferase MazF